MACIRLTNTNKQRSIAFDTLYKYTKNEEESDSLYAYFESEAFKDSFGDISKLAKLTRRVDENGEPRIYESEKGLYYLDKNNTNVYLIKKDNSSPEFADKLKTIYSNDYINKISELLLYNFIKDRIGDNFNDFDLSSKKGTLKESIVEKLTSKSEELKASTDIMQNIEAESLAKSIDYIDEWVSKVENKFKSIKLIYKEESESDQLIEEENSERGELFRKSSFEKNSKDNISANVKLRLSLLESNELDEIFYEPKFEKFDEVYSSLQKILTDNKALPNEDLFKIYVDQILRLSTKKAYLKNLYIQLTDKTLPENIKAEFVQAFNLDRNNFIGTTYNIEFINDAYKVTSLVQNLSDVGAKHNFVKSNWHYNYTKADTNIANLLKSYKGFVNDYKSNLSKGSVDMKSTIKNLNIYLNKVGIVTTEKGFNHYLDGMESLMLEEKDRIQNLTKLVESFNYFLTNLNSKKIDRNSNPFDDQVEIVNLAKAEAFFLSEGSDSSIFSVGKSKWVYSYPSYLSGKIKEWKKNPNLLLEHLNSTVYNQGSYYMNYLLALDGAYSNREKVSLERLNSFNLNIFNSLQEKGDAANASDNKTLSKNDAFVDTYNKILGFRKNAVSYFSTPTPADKATQYQFSVPSGMMINANTTYINGKIDISQKAKDIIFNYVNSEWERIKYTQEEIDNKDSSKLRTYYHLGPKNGLKFQLFPSLSFENFDAVKSGFSLYGKDGRPLPIELSSVKDKLETLITETVSKDIDDLHKHMESIGILEQKEDDLINKGIDSAIWDSYNGHKNTGLKVAGDIYVNSLISNVEYSKMFAGDVAYYKNMTDYKKRIPATYTDGLQLYLRPGEEFYNVAVIDNVNIATPYYEELKKLVGKEIADNYKNINSTDAQAWITPSRWKFLKERLGKWSTADDIVYSKMNGENKQPFTPEELKRAAQPLKGVYFEINEGVPVYLKYSQAVLVPSLINNSKGLKKIYDAMVASKTDEVVTLDGIKVGANTPVLTHNTNGNVADDFKLTPVSLKNSGWKLQQDLPVKGIKATQVGSQIQKTIYSGLANNLEEIFNINDKEFTGSEMIERINSIVKRLSDKGVDKLKNNLGIDKNFKITNPEKLQASLLEELKARGASDNVIEALENGTSSYGIPGYQQKIQNAFASMVRNAVIKIETNGGSFIQMSNYGLNKSEADSKGTIWTPWSKDTTYEYELLENGKIRPAGILLSGSFIAKYIPDYKDYTPEELFGTKEKDYKDAMIDKRILENIIGYRIPNQGLASNDALEIAGILPEEMGDTVVAYTGVTTKTGSDFDIDKMYLMMPNFVTNEYEVNSFRRANDVLSLFDALENVKSDSKVYSLSYVKPTGEIEDMSLPELQNALIEAYKGSILNANVIKDVMTPIDYPFMEQDIKSISPKEKDGDLANFNIINEINLKYEFMAGKAGVGIEANAVVDHVRGLLGDLRFNSYYLGSGNIKQGETKFDEEYSVELSESDMKFYEKETGIKPQKKIKIANTLSALLNAYVDIAKDPYITRGNWTTQTANTGNMLIRAGVHPYYVNAILAQPIISEYISFVNNSESIVVGNSGNLQDKFNNKKIKEYIDSLEDNTIIINGITKRKSLVFEASPNLNAYTISKLFKVGKNNEDIKDLISEIEVYINDYGIYDKSTNVDINNFSLSRLRNNIKNPNNSDQLAILKQFYKWQQDSKQLVKNINASKIDVTGYGKNVTSLIALDNLINSLLNNNTEGSFKGFGTKLGTNILGSYKENGIDFVKNVMEANPTEFLIANTNIINTFNAISEGIFAEPLMNEKLATKLENNYYSYLMSGFDPFILSLEAKKDLIDNIPDRVLEAKKDDNNVFLNELEVKLGDNNRSFIVMSNRKKSVDFQTEITNAWEDLMDTDPELAEDLIKYSYLTSGFQMNLNQFYTYIPYSYFVDNNINDYIQQTSIDLTKETTIDNNFIDNFFRSNINDNQIVPFIFNSDIDNEFNSNTGFITAKKLDIRFVKKKVTVKDAYQNDMEYFQLFELKGYTKEDKSIYIRRAGLGITDNKGNKIVEYGKGLEVTPTFLTENNIKIVPEQKELLLSEIYKLPSFSNTNIDNNITEDIELTNSNINVLDLISEEEWANMTKEEQNNFKDCN